MLRYSSYAQHFKRRYGTRLQKLSVDAGFSCPNRGEREQGGCTFCRNAAFNPSYCTPSKSITQQLEEGIEFHRRRYRHAGRYLAYFQAYSNTYAPLEVLRQRYEEALRHPEVEGLVIGTRPDCVDNSKLDYIATLSRRCFVALEYGVESCYDATLQRIRRGHDFDCSRRAIEATAARGIHCGIHLILGLPGESRQAMVDEAAIISRLPVNSLKLHQLQIIKGTAMEEEARRNPALFPPIGLEAYVGLVCDFLERLRPDILIERFAGEVPPRFQAFTERSWRRKDGRLLRNEEIPPLVESELERRGSWQGKHCEEREQAAGEVNQLCIILADK